MMKKYFLLCLMGLSFLGAKESLIDKIKEKEREMAVPRESVPVEESEFLIDKPIPKTAHHLPFLQTLLNIKPGTLPNPIGVSFIGSHMVERYRIKKFNGTIGNQIGKSLCQNPSIAPPEYQGMLKFACLLDPNGNLINKTTGAGETKEWKLSEGTIETETTAIGIKADMFLFPFMQIFVTGAYLHMEQSTNVGRASIPMKKSGNSGLDKLIPDQMAFNVGIISNSLDGWLVMGGTNLMIGYKGFFASLMLSGGYVQLDDHANDVMGFVQKPFMYIAPRIGYSYHGIVTAHFGVQRIELFGATSGKDLSKSTGGLVAGYSVEIEKFPVNFLAGLQFMFARDMGLSIEYVGSPDTNGLNAEIAFRF